MHRLVCVLGFLFSVGQTLGFLQVHAVGEVTPKNALGLVNDILKLNCTIFDTSVLNSSLLFWECPSNILADPEDVTQDGDQSSLFQKNITDINMEGGYLCRRKDKNPRDLNSIVGYAYVKVEYEAVRNVTDFICVLDQERQEFRCTWELGEYNHEANLNVKVKVSPNNGIGTVDCPRQKLTKRSCVWTKDDLSSINSMSKIVILNITNKEFKVSKVFIKGFWTQTITKPLPTTFINVTSQRLCGCANLTWGTIPGGVNTTTSITLMSQWNTVPLNSIVDVNNSLVVCDLVPATVYSVVVKLKPLEGYYYSNSSETDFETCHMEPSIAPVMASSWYSRSDCAASNPDFTHTVTVYWQRIPDKYQNGPLLEYQVFLDGALVDQMNHSEVLTSLAVPCHGDHNVSVRGCNKLGCSPKSSILISYYKDVVRPEKVIVEQIKNSPEVYLTWFGVEKENLRAVDIVWCKKKPAGYRCSDDIQVLRSNSTMHKVLHADEIGVAIDEVLFGVAAINARNISSGIRWQEECRYFKDEAIPIVQSVFLSDDPPQNSLTLTWKPVECVPGVENVYISQYQIVYCQLAETENACAVENVKNVSASSVVPVTLRNLDPTVRYRIWVRAVSHAKMGPKSKMVEGQPFNNDFSKESVVAIVLGGIFGIIFIIAGCIFILRQIKKTLHLNEKFEIETPVVDSFSNLPKETPQYHSIPLLSDRSSGLFITANGTTSNGTTPHDSPYGNCKSFLHRRGARGRVTDSGESIGPESTTKVNDLTLPFVDVPRQISKDSGHGSLTPTSLNPPTTPEKSDKDNYNLKECVLDHEDILHRDTKATTIAAHCLHGDGEESGSPSSNKEQNQCQATNINQMEIKMDLTRGNVTYQSNVNQDSQRTAVDQLVSGRTVSMNGSENKEDIDSEADLSRPHCQTPEHLSEDPKSFDHVSSVLLDYVPNTTINPSPAAFISNEKIKQSTMDDVQNGTKEESHQHYVTNRSVTDYVPNGTKNETPTHFVPNGLVTNYIPNGTKEQTPHPFPNGSVKGYVLNGTKESTPSHYVPNRSLTDFVPNETDEVSPKNYVPNWSDMDNVPNGTKEESTSHYVPNETKKGYTSDYVPNETKEESPHKYVPNGSVGEGTEPLSEYIRNESVIDSVFNKADQKCLFRAIPSGSRLSPLPNEPIKLSELGYVSYDKDNVIGKDIHFDCDVTKSPSLPLYNQTTSMAKNPDQRIETWNSIADFEGESDEDNFCSNNNDYISKEMLDSEGNVLDVTKRPGNFREEEEDSVVLNLVMSLSAQ